MNQAPVDARVWRDLPAELCEGIARDELFLLYQPQVDMPAGRVVGAEALCRWRHPVHGLLQPADFLPPLGDHEAGRMLADWAIAQAVAQMAHWARAGHPLSVSVNIGVKQLMHPDTLPRIATHLQQIAPSPSARLELELLETSAIDDFDAVAQRIAECRQLGVDVAIDDFGTGNASFTWLRHLPVSTLKLDQSFVGGALHSSTDAAIVRHLLALARELSLEAVAEGVESPAHGELLMSLGCRVGQGFAIAHPLATHDFIPWLQAYERTPVWSGPARNRAA